MYSLMANCFEWIRRRKEPTRAVTLVVIGLDDAGKTTMVASLQGEPPDGITPTIGFANAEFTINKCKVTAYDLGGGVRIRDVWRKYYAEVFGVVFVVDSCNSQRVEELKEVFQQVAAHSKILGKPFLIFANKQDKEGALPSDEITSILELEELSEKHGFSFKVVSCSALKGYGRGIDKNINTGFQWLMSTITNEFGKISARVEHDVAIQREEEEREKEARRERIKKIREERDRLEREAGGDPDKEDSDDDIVMANPFQPIGKHLENVKSKEKKKKSEKEKKVKAEPTHKEADSKLEAPQTEVPQVKKKKKKKKKIVRVIDEDDVRNDVNDDVTHDEVDNDRNDVRHRVIVTSTVENDEHIMEHVSEDNEHEPQVVVKKKKKKPKAKIVEENFENNSGDEETTNISPPGVKKRKKKKKNFATLDDDLVDNQNDVQSEMRHQNDLDIERENRFDDHDGIEHAESLESVIVKKPKMKKRKKKKNRTVPIDDVPEEGSMSLDSLPAPSWKTPSSSWTSLPPIGNNGDAHSGGLPPIKSSKTKRGLGETSIQQLPVSPSWARTRPNSEDHDLVT